MDIEIENLGVEFADTVALSDVSISFAKNTIHGLLGRNGAGKTTLLSVLAGFRMATRGTVLVGGMPVFENPAATRQICLVREAPDTLDASDKVSDTLELTARMRPGWDQDLARDLLVRFELDTGKKIGSLSRGMRAALGIVIGMATRAPVTIFDESYLGLDAPSRYVFYESLLADYTKYPRTFIISTHLIEEVSSLFETVSIIHKGRLLLQDDADELRSMGTEVVGPSERVERFVEGRSVLATRTVGQTKSVTIARDGTRLSSAEVAGLELNPVPLQDLFVHLTRKADHE